MLCAVPSTNSQDARTSPTRPVERTASSCNLCCAPRTSHNDMAASAFLAPRHPTCILHKVSRPKGAREATGHTREAGLRRAPIRPHDPAQHFGPTSSHARMLAQCFPCCTPHSLAMLPARRSTLKSYRFGPFATHMPRQGSRFTPPYRPQREPRSPLQAPLVPICVPFRKLRHDWLRLGRSSLPVLVQHCQQLPLRIPTQLSTAAASAAAAAATTTTR